MPIVFGRDFKDRTVMVAVLLILSVAMAGGQLYSLLVQDAAVAKAQSHIDNGDHFIREMLRNGYFPGDPNAGSFCKSAYSEYVKSSADYIGYIRAYALASVVAYNTGAFPAPALKSYAKSVDIKGDDEKRTLADAVRQLDSIYKSESKIIKPDAVFAKLGDVPLGELRYIIEIDIQRIAGNELKAADLEQKAFVRLRTADAVMNGYYTGVVVGGIIGALIIFYALSIMLPNIGRFSVEPLPTKIHALFSAFLITLLIRSFATWLSAPKLENASPGPFFILTSLYLIAEVGIVVAIIARYNSGRIRAALAEIGFRAVTFQSLFLHSVFGYLSELGFLLVGGIIFTQIQSATGLPDQQNPALTFMDSSSPISFVFAIILGVLIAPAVEEFLFRGVLFKALRNSMGFLPSALLCSLIFAVFHPFPGHFLQIFGVGFTLCFVRESSKSLVPGIVAHALFNLGGVAAAWFAFV